MERCGGDRGKGFFWDFKYAQMLEEQEAKALQDAAQGAGTKDGPKTQGQAYAFGSAAKNGASKEILNVSLPSPLTSTPLLPKALSVNAPQLSTLVQVPNSGKNTTMVT